MIFYCIIITATKVQKFQLEIPIFFIFVLHYVCTFHDKIKKIKSAKADIPSYTIARKLGRSVNDVEKTLREIFDFHRFQPNARLAKFINGTRSRYGISEDRPLNDDLLTLVNAAGTSPSEEEATSKRTVTLGDLT